MKTSEDAFDELIATLLDAAEEHGKEKRELAKGAQITPESFSRMLTRHDGKFSYLHAIAVQVGMKIVAVPDDDLITDIESGDFFL